MDLFKKFLKMNWIMLRREKPQYYILIIVTMPVMYLYYKVTRDIYLSLACTISLLLASSAVQFHKIIMLKIGLFATLPIKRGKLILNQIAAVSLLTMLHLAFILGTFIVYYTKFSEVEVNWLYTAFYTFLGVAASIVYGSFFLFVMNTGVKKHPFDIVFLLIVMVQYLFQRPLIDCFQVFIPVVKQLIMRGDYQLTTLRMTIAGGFLLGVGVMIYFLVELYGRFRKMDLTMGVREMFY